MRTYSYYYLNHHKLLANVQKDKIDPSLEALIQIFNGRNSKQKMQEVVDSVHVIFPKATIISTTTAGEIFEGVMSENTVVVSISIFEMTSLKAKLFEKDEPRKIAQSISDLLITPKTKLLIIFNSIFHIDGESLIESIDKINDNKIMLAGGNAGDNNKFIETLVGVGTNISNSGVAVVALDSDFLQVINGQLLNWKTIGKTMTVTKAKASTIYEIDNTPVLDIYKHYLGDDVASNLPASAIEFPLIFKDEDIEIARSPAALGDKGSLIMAAHIEEGAEVKFAFGNQKDNDKDGRLTIGDLSKNPIESIFIYSCSARKKFFKNHINEEFNLFQQIAPTAGFITYGEFYHDKHSHLLNVTSTFIALNESKTKSNEISFSPYSSQYNKTFNALYHLMKVTVNDLNANSHSLQQFQSLVREVTLYSATDKRGIIIDANEKFCKISGYKRDELIGISHNIVRHPSVPKSTYKEMWKTIKNKKIWKGVIENIAKDGSSYFVSSNVIPILDINNEILYYISIREDITQEILKKQKLEGEASLYQQLLEEKEDLLNQYENVINSSNAFIRVDSDFIITYANDVFCSLFKYNKENIIGIHHDEIIEPTFLKENKKRVTNLLTKNKQWSGIIKLQRFSGSIFFVDATYNAIYNKKGEVVEYMAIYHDITELIKTQEEITKTQTDVVLTMGAIGETRSKETGNHVKRVAEYSKELALLYGLSIDDAELLKTASPMHDIGKIGIPDSILNKPGKLTQEEFEIMKTHSTLGFSMLKHSMRPILKTAALVALTHHERWDGKGYPKNLKGKRIPIIGRITAVADVFDALGSDRCYKKAWSDEDIFKLLRDGRGTQFDPELIDIFFENLDIFLKIRETFKD